jgi:hypothetical protein
MSTDTNEQPIGRFQPKTLREFFALQLAQRLGDEDNLSSYLSLLGTYSVPFLLDVFEVAKESATTPEALRERFWSQLGEDQEWRKDE